MEGRVIEKKGNSVNYSIIKKLAYNIEKSLKKSTSKICHDEEKCIFK